MAPVEAEIETTTIAKVPQQRENQEEMRSPGGFELPPAEGARQQRPPPANFSEAIDRIGLGPFQTRLVIMCGMVSEPAAVVSACCKAVQSFFVRTLLSLKCGVI